MILQESFNSGRNLLLKEILVEMLLNYLKSEKERLLNFFQIWFVLNVWGKLLKLCNRDPPLFSQKTTLKALTRTSRHYKLDDIAISDLRM